MTGNRAAVLRTAAVALATALTFTGSAVARAADGAGGPGAPPPPGSVSATVSTVNGSGCLPGSVNVALAPDNTLLQLTNLALRAQIGGGAKPTDVRKNCQVAVQIRVPAGYSFAVQRVDYRGGLDLASGATALVRSSYYWAGSIQRVPLIRTFKGPAQEPWEAVDLVEDDALIWAFCGMALTVSLTNEVRVARGTADPGSRSAIVLGDPTGDAPIDYHLAWRKCPGA